MGPFTLNLIFKIMEVLVGGDYPKKVIPMIDAATRNIDVVVYDWRWYENDPGHPVQQFNLAMIRAVRRGVQVRAILNAPDLIPTLNALGIKARTLKDKRVLHAKLLLIDQQTLVIGSHNFTSNAFTRNLEMSIVENLDSVDNRAFTFFNNLYNT